MHSEPICADLSDDSDLDCGADIDAYGTAHVSARQVAVERAPVDVFVGLDSDDRPLAGSFAVVGSARVVEGAERSCLSRARTHP